MTQTRSSPSVNSKRDGTPKKQVALKRLSAHGSHQGAGSVMAYNLQKRVTLRNPNKIFFNLDFRHHNQVILSLGESQNCPLKQKVLV
jgi:hypothetical protein